MHSLNNRQLATVLAALRYWQREGLLSSGCELDIATDGGSIEHLSVPEIDDLCEALNLADPPVVVLEIEGSVIHCVKSSAPVHVVILDADTEGADEENIRTINDEEVYLSEYKLTNAISDEDIDADYVSEILEQLATQGS